LGFSSSLWRSVGLMIHYGVFDLFTFVSSVFVHGSVGHLVNNVVFFLLFGFLLLG
jgi:membrane associated rhomboid family serine protease